MVAEEMSSTLAGPEEFVRDGGSSSADDMSIISAATTTDVTDALLLLPDEAPPTSWSAPRRSPETPEPSPFVAALSYICWAVLAAFALFRAMLLRLHIETNLQAQERHKQRHFAPLYNHWDQLFTQYIFRRLHDVSNRPIVGKPGVVMSLVDRVSYDANWTYEYRDSTTDVINLGSYNYLGFAEHNGCNEEAIRVVDSHGIGICSPYHETGTNDLHKRLEATMADFIGVEDCFCTPMGFATNTMNIPALVGDDGLIISDELNHASIILGCRYSCALTKVFRHNSVRDCERVIVQALLEGNPRTGRPFSKILIVIEGLYSMEGTIPHLADFVRLKKKYSCYLFLDEAHSIGAMGRTGRGICEYWGVDPYDVDVLMGTFTKSFSAAGGYIAGRRDVINRIRLQTHAAYAATMAPPVAAQVLAALRVLTGNDGTNEGARRLAALHANTRHFRRRLREAGFLVVGNADAPVVPTLAFFPTKIVELSRRLLDRHRIGIVVVGYPATPLASERARFCLSAAHTIEQLDYAIDCLIDVGDRCNIRYLKDRPLYDEDGGAGDDLDGVEGCEL